MYKVFVCLTVSSVELWTLGWEMCLLISVVLLQNVLAYSHKMAVSFFKTFISNFSIRLIITIQTLQM